MAPPPVKVTVVPEHTDEPVDVAVTVGKAFTDTLTDAVLVQPFTSVPVTLYVVVPVGVNATASTTPLSHAYDVAPPPVKVTDVPEQTEELVEEAVTIGKSFTVTLTDAVFVQAFASVPITLYVVVPVGTKAVPSITLLSQTYVVAPPPVNVTDVPEQTEELVEVAVTVGKAFTVTDWVEV